MRIWLLAASLSLLGCLSEAPAPANETLCQVYCACTLFSPTLTEQCTQECVQENSFSGAGADCAQCFEEMSCDELEQGACNERCSVFANQAE